jgi:hypothetical protein
MRGVTGGDDKPEQMGRVPGQRIGDDAEIWPKVRVILKVEGESADGSYALGNARGPDSCREMQRICRHRIEGQQACAESELADEVCQAFV